MADSTSTVSVQGLPQVLAAFNRLGPVLAKKWIRRSTRAGAKALVTEAKARALQAFGQRTGAVRRNITLTTGKKPTNLVGRYVVGVRHIITTQNLAGGVKKSAKALRRIRLARGMKKLIAESGGFEAAIQLSGRTLAKRGLNPYYYRFLEFGTKYQRKRSFLEPAIVHGGDDGLKKMRDELLNNLAAIATEARR